MKYLRTLTLAFNYGSEPDGFSYDSLLRGGNAGIFRTFGDRVVILPTDRNACAELRGALGQYLATDMSWTYDDFEYKYCSRMPLAMRGGQHGIHPALIAVWLQENGGKTERMPDSLLGSTNEQRWRNMDEGVKLYVKGCGKNAWFTRAAAEEYFGLSGLRKDIFAVL